MPKKFYTAHAMNGKKAAISTHKTYTNLGAAKYDARQMAKLIPNGKGLVVKHNPMPVFSDPGYKLVGGRHGLQGSFKTLAAAKQHASFLYGGRHEGPWKKVSHGSTREAYPGIEIEEWSGGPANDFYIYGPPKRINPSLRDYFTAGKKAVMGAAEQAAAEAQEAAKRARIAAAEAEKQRNIDSPEKALKVLAAQQGYDLVRKNPGSWKKEISAWGKLPFLRFAEAYSDEFGDHAVFDVIKGFVFQASRTLDGPKREWTARRILVSKRINSFTKKLEFSVDLQGHSPTDILDVIDQDFEAPTLNDAKSKLRSMLSEVKFAPRKNPRDNRPGPQLVFGHEVRKIKGGYRIVPYHLDLPNLSAVKAYLRAHVAQEKK